MMFKFGRNKHQEQQPPAQGQPLEQQPDQAALYGAGAMATSATAEAQPAAAYTSEPVPTVDAAVNTPTQTSAGGVEASQAMGGDAATATAPGLINYEQPAPTQLGGDTLMGSGTMGQQIDKPLPVRTPIEVKDGSEATPTTAEPNTAVDAGPPAMEVAPTPEPQPSVVMAPPPTPEVATPLMAAPAAPAMPETMAPPATDTYQPPQPASAETYQDPTAPAAEAAPAPQPPAEQAFSPSPSVEQSNPMDTAQAPPPAS